MHVKTPVYCDKAYVEAKEQQLREFLRTGALSGNGADRSVLLLVRSPECLVARTLCSVSKALAQAGYSAKIIFAAGCTAGTGDTWSLAFDPAFFHETRILRDNRYLDGHEQLVCGSDHVWFGDSMRREPDKRDAYSSFIPSNTEMTSRARSTFARIWEAGEPVCSRDQSAVPSATDEVAEAIAATSLAAEITATLTEWTPTDRH